NRGGNLRLLDQDYFIDIPLNQRKGQLSYIFHSNTIRHRWRKWHGDNLSPIFGIFHGRRIFCLNANNFTVWIFLFHCNGYAGNQPSPANRNDHSIWFDSTSPDFQSDGPLPANDFLIIEGMNEI